MTKNENKIRILDEKIINQIAAGEVVEDPASVVKELVENALDAKASFVHIEVQGGGFVKIQIDDDGLGMRRDDAILCLERHATSKVRTYDDVCHLRTMGFRGEALSSIGAVSKLTLITSDGEEGTKIESVGGKILAIESVGRPRGTRFEIRSLFFNTPARKKFQKSATASQAKINRLVAKLAFANPGVTFVLVVGEKEMLRFERACVNERAIDLLSGMRTTALQVQKGPYCLTGALGEARSSRLWQFLALNGRLVESAVVSEAVKEGLGTRIGVRDHPSYALHLTLDPAAVDVNIHPQKLLVRFEDVPSIQAMIREAVSSQFSKPQQIAFSPVKVQAQSFQWALQEESAMPPPPPLCLEGLEPVGIYAHFLLLRGEALVLFHLPRAYKKLHGERDETPCFQTLLQPLKLAVPAYSEIDCTRLEGRGIKAHRLNPTTLLVEATWPGIEEIERVVFEGSGRREEGGRHRFSFEEALAMLEGVKKAPDPYRDERGRDLFAKFDKDALERFFT